MYAATDRIFVPWRNGGGETAEIVVSPPGAGFEIFEWRVSTAIIGRDGPFSIFEDVDRVLTVIEGGPLNLNVGGESYRLDASSPPLAFPGDLACQASLEGDGVLDFNVMTRRPIRATVTRGPLRTDHRLALLLAPQAGLKRLDTVDFARCDAALATALIGTLALAVTFQHQPGLFGAGANCATSSCRSPG